MTNEWHRTDQTDAGSAWLDRVLREHLRGESVTDDGFTDSVLRELRPVVRSDEAPTAARAWRRHWANLLLLAGLVAVVGSLISLWPDLLADLIRTQSQGAVMLVTNLSAQRWLPGAALLGLLIWWSWCWSVVASE